jgi:hypothetical protein
VRRRRQIRDEGLFVHILYTTAADQQLRSDCFAAPDTAWPLHDHQRGGYIMTNPMPVGQKEREAETAEARKNEGSGTVANVTPDQTTDDETEELKEAMHQVEEEKGDWSKGH